MKKAMLLLAIITLVLFAGCELEPDITFESIEGGWVFDDGWTAGVVSEDIIDIWHYDGVEQDFAAYVFGELEGKEFVGTYHTDTDLETDYSITLTLSLSGDTLSITCSGEGPLDGRTLTGGTRASEE